MSMVCPIKPLQSRCYNFLIFLSTLIISNINSKPFMHTRWSAARTVPRLTMQIAAERLENHKKRSDYTTCDERQRRWNEERENWEKMKTEKKSESNSTALHSRKQRKCIAAQFSYELRVGRMCEELRVDRSVARSFSSVKCLCLRCSLIFFRGY